MAIVIECNYSKKLGLPNYSSHQYSVTVRSEITDLAQLERTNAQLYAILQQAVDSQIQEVGFLPDATRYGMVEVPAADKPQTPAPRNGKPGEDTWSCSDKQKELILKLVAEHALDKRDVDALADERFGKSVTQLNKLEASGLIDALIEQTGGSPRRQNGQRRFSKTGGGR
jgi:hypothetical protein